MSHSPAPSSLNQLVEDMRGGSRPALARLITEVERGSRHCPAIYQAVYPHLGRARVVGITGPPGVGKSTLTGALIAAIRERNESIGVVAVDPSSPLTGGAILGDRVRMTLHGEDPEVFIRSIASRGHLGGLASCVSRVVDLMDAAGKHWILLETVGAGQSEVEVAAIADITVVVMAPGLGDDVQAIKAGILEIADVLVVNKADRPQANQTVRQLKQMIALRKKDGLHPEVLKTTATDGEGVPQLLDCFDRIATGYQNGEEGVGIRRIDAAITAALTDRVNKARQSMEDKDWQHISASVQRGETSMDEAVTTILSLISR